MRQGHKVKEGAQPMKTIKQRAVTINKRRAVEMALAEHNGDRSGEGNEGGLMQGLYAKNQTELYIPPPVVDVSFSLSGNPFNMSGAVNLRLTESPSEFLRASFSRMTLGILIFMSPQCYRKELSTFLVRCRIPCPTEGYQSLTNARIQTRALPELPKALGWIMQKQLCVHSRPVSEKLVPIPLKCTGVVRVQEQEGYARCTRYSDCV